MISIKLVVALMRRIVIIVLIIIIRIRRLSILHWVWFDPHLMAMLVGIAILLRFIFTVGVILRSVIVLYISVP